MEKDRLKKLASLGLLGGVMLSGGALQADLNSQAGNYYAHACGGSQGSGGMDNMPNGGGSSCRSRNNCSGRSQNSCSSKSQNNGQNSGQGGYQGCNSKHGCHGSSTPSQSISYRDIPYYTPPSSPLSENDEDANENSNGSNEQENSQNNKDSMSEQDLTMQLNPQTKALFQSLSPEGKSLALKLANQDCKGKNDCKGLNSCKTDNNSCAGQGGCKGKSPGKFKDKNTAVKVAAMKMAEKRKSSMQ